MNSTPKDRVKARHPDCYLAGAPGAFRVFRREGDATVLGAGTTPARAWKRAAEGLNGQPRPPGKVPKAQSMRGF